jgi:hypothetical protein
MKPRISLQKFLETFLGSRNVYFQPPESLKISYPAIVYNLADIQTLSADNAVYRQYTAYQITLIDKDPDSEFIRKMALIPMCRFNRFFTSDNLNHFVYTLYY